MKLRSYFGTIRAVEPKNTTSQQTSQQDIADALASASVSAYPVNVTRKRSVMPLFIGILILLCGVIVALAILLPAGKKTLDTSTTTTESVYDGAVPVGKFIESIVMLKIDEAATNLDENSLIKLLGLTQATLDKFAGSDVFWDSCKVQDGPYMTRNVTQDSAAYEVVYVPVACVTESANSKLLNFDVRKTGAKDWLIYDIVAKNQ